MSVDGWPTEQSLVRRHLAEANATAKNLKHKLSAWSNVGRHWKARCERCGDFATVRPKGLGSEIGGAATILDCRPYAPAR
jgi:hypothetical protein